MVPTAQAPLAPQSLGGEKLPTLRLEFEAWIRKTCPELTENQVQALLRGFHKIFDTYKEMVRESHELLLLEMRKITDVVTKRVTESINKQRASEISRIIESFQAKIRELQDSSARDPLTGLLHYRAFTDRLTYFLGSKEKAASCAVGVIDLASFKKINDQGSHSLGDEALIKVARQMEESIRPRDIFARDQRLIPRSPQFNELIGDLHARHGGDQFAFLISNARSWKVAKKISERFQGALEESTPKEILERFGYPIQADIGVVWCELNKEHSVDPATLARALFQAADSCMYKAKRRAKVRTTRGLKNLSRVYLRTVRIDAQKGRLLVLNNHNDFVENSFPLYS